MVNIKKKTDVKKKINTKKKTNIKNKETNKKINNKNILKIILIIIFTLGIIGFSLLFAFLFMVVKDAPDFDAELLYSTESTVLYDKNGEIMAKIGMEKRKNVTYDQLPEVLVNAIIATEDSRFFQHNGVDFPRFFVASVYQVLGKDAGGASTLTMQLSKTTYTSNTASGFEGIKRKFTDLYMSLFKIEKAYTKEQIIEFYVNSNFLGARSWGVEQACQTYFGKSVTDINLAEASIIAGLFQAPSSYNPLAYPEKTEKRRKTVLELMVRHGYITEEEKNIALSIPVAELIKTEETNQEEYQDFIDTVIAEVEKVTGNDPYNVPMEIYTTMDPKLQDHINKIMNGETFKWENQFVDAGISVVETKTGAIRAIGAGRNHVATGFNTAIDTNKQIGSTAKPFYDYAPGIEYENWSTYTPWIDQPHTYSDGKTTVNNFDGYYAGFMTSREALVQSRNIPALKAFQSLNKKNVTSFVQSLGLHPEIEGNTIHEAHAIGGYTGESPLNLSAAFAAFGNKGVYNEPYSFTKIVYIESNKTYNRKLNQTEAMSEETAYMMYSMLNSAAKYIMGSNYYANGTTYGAKTGTTNYNKETISKYKLPSNAINDLWLAGVNSDYSVSVWYGYQRGIAEYTENKAITLFGNGYHRLLFSSVIKGVFKDTSTPKKPSGIVEVEIERGTLTATLPSEYTPQNYKIKEYFKKGTEPTEVSTRFTQLNNVEDVKSEYNDGILKLTWEKIKTPEQLDEEALTKYAKKYIKKEADIKYWVTETLRYNRVVLGNIGYDIYLKDENDKLILLGSTTKNEFEIEIQSTSHDLTYVVKSAYEIFKNNASKGKEITVEFKNTESITKATLNGNTNITIYVNDSFKDPGVTILDNMMDVTDQSTITTTITDENNNTVDSIDTSKPGKYYIFYKIKYNDYSKSLTRTITIEEKVEDNNQESN